MIEELLVLGMLGALLGVLCLLVPLPGADEPAPQEEDECDLCLGRGVVANPYLGHFANSTSPCPECRPPSPGDDEEDDEECPSTSASTPASRVRPAS